MKSIRLLDETVKILHSEVEYSIDLILKYYTLILNFCLFSKIDNKNYRSGETIFISINNLCVYTSNHHNNLFIALNSINNAQIT